MTESFMHQRRQSFLTEEFYQSALADFLDIDSKLLDGISGRAGDAAMRKNWAYYLFDDAYRHFSLRYTAGDSIESLRGRLIEVIEFYEEYQRALTEHIGSPDVSPLSLEQLADYEQAMQLLSLCILFHRPDLLERVSSLIDPVYKGEDALYEDILAHYQEGRFELDVLYHTEPYMPLIEAMHAHDGHEASKLLDKYMGDWYTAFQQLSWHEGHLRIDGQKFNYFGYWAFEAAAVAYVCNINDENIQSNLYPKDLISWARSTKQSLSVGSKNSIEYLAASKNNKEFEQKRRQVFLGEKYYRAMLRYVESSEESWLSHPPQADSPEESNYLAWACICDDLFHLIFLKYSAGEPVETIRDDLGRLVNAYEAQQRALGIYENSPQMSPLGLDQLGDYQCCMQIIGLCVLLHRSDLLLRISKLIDPGYKGEDTLYEDFLSFYDADRVDLDEWYHDEPYTPLVHAFYDSPDDAVGKIKDYCRRWYPAFKYVPWHDGHLRINGEDGDYFGYWAFEAGAAVFLLDLDDTEIEHLVYPKDLVAWAKANRHLSQLRSASDRGGMGVEK